MAKAKLYQIREWGMGEAVRSWGLPKWSICRHGAWGMGILKRGKGEREKPIAHCPLPIAHCPMPHAQCPMPHAQFLADSAKPSVR
jgi:hypothetical protein